MRIKSILITIPVLWVCFSCATNSRYVPIVPPSLIGVYLKSPKNNSVVFDKQIVFEWTNSGSVSEYEFEIWTDRYSQKDIRRHRTRTHSVVLKSTPNDGSVYFWRVRPYNGVSGWGGWSSVWQVQSGSSILEGPLLEGPLDNKVVEGGIIVFNWKGIQGAIRYQVQISLFSDFRSIRRDLVIEKNRVQISVPEDGLTYFWRVRAVDSRTYGNWSTIGSFRSKNYSVPGMIVLSYPGEGVNIEGREIRFEWQGDKMASSYQIQVSSNPKFGTVISSDTSRVTQIVIGGFDDNGERYFWRVAASNKKGAGPWSQTYSFFNGYKLPGKAKLIAPPNNTIVEAGKNGLTLVWNPAAYANYYLVQLSDKKGRRATKKEIRSSTNSLRIEDSLLTRGKRYFWRVKAVNQKGGNDSENNLFVYGCPSIEIYPLDGWNEYKVKSAKLQWAASTDIVKSYILEIANNINFIRAQSIKVNDNSYNLQIGHLKEGNEVFWRVRLFDEVCRNTWSKVDRFVKVDRPIRILPKEILPENKRRN